MRKDAILFSAGSYLPSKLVNMTDLMGVQYDVAAMEKRLSQLGFTVQKCEDAHKEDYLPALRNMVENSPNDAIHIVYFSGHGGHYNGKNYIYPSDFGARLDISRNVGDAALNIQDIITVFSGRGRLILILDACRADIGLSRGYYSEMTSSENVYIAYGTMFEDYSQARHGDVSWFTEAICDEILTPNIDVDALFTRVRRNIVTKHKIQIPCSVNCLTEAVVLNPQLHVDIDDKMVHDFVSRYGDEYNERYGYFQGDDLIFIDAAQYFGISFLDAVWRFRNADNQFFTERGVKVPLVSEDECKIITFLGLTRNKRYFQCDEFHTWYYNGRQIRMGEIPPLPESMQQKMPEVGKEIYVAFDVKNEDNQIVLVTNIPDGCSFFVRYDTVPSSTRVTVFHGKVILTPPEGAKKILMESTPVFSEGESRLCVGEKARNLSGDFITYHPIHGNVISCKLSW